MVIERVFQVAIVKFSCLLDHLSRFLLRLWFEPQPSPGKPSVLSKVDEYTGNVGVLQTSSESVALLAIIVE